MATRKFWSDIDMDLNEIKNLIIDKFAQDPTVTSVQAGRLIYNSNAGVLKYYNGSSWIPLTAHVKADWEALEGSPAEILNKPTIPAEQIQSNWTQTDDTEKDFIKNKPSLGTAASKNTGTSEGNVPVLDANGKLNSSVLPPIAITDTFVVNSESAMLQLDAQVGDVCIRTDVSRTFILKTAGASTLSHWEELQTPGTGVTSVGLSMPEEFSVSGSPVTTYGTFGVTRATGYENPVYAFTYINSAAVTPVTGVATITLDNNTVFSETLPSSKMPDYSKATFEVYEKTVESGVTYWDKVECDIRISGTGSNQNAYFKFNTTSNIASGQIKIVVHSGLI